MLRDRKVAHSEEVSPGVVVDYGPDGEVVGVEVIEVSKKIRCPERGSGKST